MKYKEITKLIDGRIAAEKPFLSQNINHWKSNHESQNSKRENKISTLYNMIVT